MFRKWQFHSNTGAYIQAMQRLKIPSAEMTNELRYFLQDNDIVRMQRNLRKVFFEFVKQQQAGMDVEFDTVICDIENVFLFLDKCQIEGQTYL
jgi:hypothetical protein